MLFFLSVSRHKHTHKHCLLLPVHLLPTLRSKHLFTHTHTTTHTHKKKKKKYNGVNGGLQFFILFWGGLYVSSRRCKFTEEKKRVTLCFFFFFCFRQTCFLDFIFDFNRISNFI